VRVIIVYIYSVLLRLPRFYYFGGRSSVSESAVAAARQALLASSGAGATATFGMQQGSTASAANASASNIGMGTARSQTTVSSGAGKDSGPIVQTAPASATDDLPVWRFDVLVGQWERVHPLLTPKAQSQAQAQAASAKARSGSSLSQRNKNTSPTPGSNATKARPSSRVDRGKPSTEDERSDASSSKDTGAPTAIPEADPSLDYARSQFPANRFGHAAAALNVVQTAIPVPRALDAFYTWLQTQKPVRSASMVTAGASGGGSVASSPTSNQQLTAFDGVFVCLRSGAQSMRRYNQ
jgi:hypothetical protein